ncbi:MAG: hypothetical protein JXM69_07800 [Anaerolineae bacterium]|nr:hypothetical protein [Anaerolineae bacterium]
MFKNLSRFRHILPLSCLIFGLNLILSPVALGDELNPANGSYLWIQASNRQTQPDSPLIPTFILLTGHQPSRLAQIQTIIKTNGGQITHTFPHQALIANMPAAIHRQLTALPDVAVVLAEPVDLATIDIYGPDARRYASVWNSLVTPQPETTTSLASLAAEHPAESHPDALTAPDLPADGGLGVAATSVTPGYYQTSEYMAGSVAVGIVLVESDGSQDLSTENWTNDEKQQVFNEIVAAFNWWAGLEPRANLSFVYDDHLSQPLPTGVEPITRPYYHQRYWIGDAMSTLGYSAFSYFTQVRDYNNALRTTYQTDWAFTIFVVDSSADQDNRFSDGYFAYAYLGGPFMVMTYGNNGYGPGNMDAIAAHEMGHIFLALDQYYSAYQSCTLRSGYLDVENQNSQYGGCASNVASIMRGQTYPYTIRAIDPFAAGQIGWRDSDGDNILDPLDTELPITIDNIAQDENNVTISGATQIIPYPSPRRTDVTINTLTAVQYRFNNGAWQSATATDGAFDSTAETYHFSTSLPPGLYHLDVAALDSAGNLSDVYATATIIIPDPVDGGLNTQLYPPDHPLYIDEPITLEGLAYHLADGIVTQVEYQLDGGVLQPAEAQDGAFDSGYESFNLNITPLSAGIHTVEVTATDDEGNVEINAASLEIQVSEPRSYQVLLPLIIK